MSELLVLDDLVRMARILLRFLRRHFGVGLLRLQRRLRNAAIHVQIRRLRPSGGSRPLIRRHRAADARPRSGRRATLGRMPDRGRLVISVLRPAAYLEDNLHVVGGAAAADAAMQVVLRRGADKVVIVARRKLEAAGLRRERSEGDGVVEQLVRLITDGDYAGCGVGDTTRVVLFLGDVVDDVLLGVLIVSAGSVDRADDVHLVVVELRIALVHRYYVVGVVYPEDGVRGVPVDVERFGAVTDSA